MRESTVNTRRDEVKDGTGDDLLGGALFPRIMTHYPRGLEEQKVRGEKREGIPGSGQEGDEDLSRGGKEGARDLGLDLSEPRGRSGEGVHLATDLLNAS